MEWDEDKQIFTHNCVENKFMDENLIRNVTRDILKALRYSYKNNQNS